MDDSDRVKSAITPYLITKGAEQAIAFYVAAFDAVENYRLVDPHSGKLGHAELRVGDAVLMLADEHPDFGAFAPPTIGGTPVMLHLSVADSDAVVAKAERAGATVLRPVKDQMYGERSGMIADPFGHHWMIGTPTESVTPEQMQERYDDAI